jgi:hypothetical protein
MIFLVVNHRFSAELKRLQGPMLWFFKYFCRKIHRKYWRFWRKTKLVFAKIVIITLVFEKNANFFAENRRKLWS